MRPLHILVFAALLPWSAVAQSPAEGAAIAVATTVDVAADIATDAETIAVIDPDAFAPVAAADVVMADLLYIKRPVVVFADSPNDPSFIRQMQLIERNWPELVLRDVILITDTDPAARTPVRLQLRPRGFSLVLMDKDGKTTLRKPLPWDVREITAAIDKFPLRRQEILEQSPSGR